jgi:hypothetical protein
MCVMRVHAQWTVLGPGAHGVTPRARVHAARPAAAVDALEISRSLSQPKMAAPLVPLLMGHQRRANVTHTAAMFRWIVPVSGQPGASAQQHVVVVSTHGLIRL